MGIIRVEREGGVGGNRAVGGGIKTERKRGEGEGDQLCASKLSGNTK